MRLFEMKLHTILLFHQLEINSALGKFSIHNMLYIRAGSRLICEFWEIMALLRSIRSIEEKFWNVINTNIYYSKKYYFLEWICQISDFNKQSSHPLTFYFLLHGKESIVFGSDFQNWGFDEIICFQDPWTWIWKPRS